jgi:hypothetical protein
MPLRRRGGVHLGWYFVCGLSVCCVCDESVSHVIHVPCIHVCVSCISVCIVAVRGLLCMTTCVYVY